MSNEIENEDEHGVPSAIFYGAFRSAQAAYKKGLALEPCPLGAEENDQYADDEAFYAACASGVSNETARAIADLLTDSLGDPHENAIEAVR